MDKNEICKILSVNYLSPFKLMLEPVNKGERLTNETLIFVLKKTSVHNLSVCTFKFETLNLTKNQYSIIHAFNLEELVDTLIWDGFEFYKTPYVRIIDQSVYITAIKQYGH